VQHNVFLAVLEIMTRFQKTPIANGLMVIEWPRDR